MSTLAEIKSATDRLPRAEQEELFRDLAGNLRAKRTEADAMSHKNWMVQLQALRNSIGAGEPKIGSEQILEELRAERN